MGCKGQLGAVCSRCAIHLTPPPFHLNRRLTKMVHSWQLWLSPRPLERSKTSHQTAVLAADDAALFEFKKEDDGRWVVVETHYMDNKIVREGRSGPPL